METFLYIILGVIALIINIYTKAKKKQKGTAGSDSVQTVLSKIENMMGNEVPVSAPSPTSSLSFDELLNRLQADLRPSSQLKVAKTGQKQDNKVIDVALAQSNDDLSEAMARLNELHDRPDVVAETGRFTDYAVKKKSGSVHPYAIKMKHIKSVKEAIILSEILKPKF